VFQCGVIFSTGRGCGSEATVTQILDVVHKAEETLAAGNLGDVMVPYATQYKFMYHELK
jgi:hypothetical protein